MQKVKLGDILIMQKGKKPINESPVRMDGYLPYIDILAFEKGIFTSFADGERCLSCEDGDLLIVCDGARSGLVGRAKKGYVGSTLAKISAKGLVNDYLAYFLQSKYQLLNTKMKGTGTPHINPTILKDSMLFILPDAGQQRIVEKIEELFSDLDSAVADLNKAKAQLKVYRQAVLKQAFEGELSSQYRNSKKLINWQITSLDKIVLKDKNAIKAGPFGSSLKKDTYVSNGYKIYGQEQVIAGDENLGNYFIDEKKYGELSSCKISPNDILISLVGTVGKVLILSEKCKKGIINPRLVKISLNEKLMLPKFFKYYFESEYLKSLYRLKTHGATMDVLNLRMIKELPYPICDVIEQSYVVTEIEARLSICDKIEQTVNESLLKAESLRQSILKQAFEGKLVK